MATTAQHTVEPYHEQEPFLWDSHRYYGFISGVGAGKTAVGVMRTALNAELWNRGSMGAIVAPSTRMIKNAIFPVMREFGLRDRWDFSGFQAQEPGFSTPEGGRIVILSADNERTVERLANLNLAYWWLDEAKETPRRAREILQERLRVGNYRNGYITTTPKGFDHNYDFFVGDPRNNEILDERTYGNATLYEADNRLCVAHVPSWANPHNPEDYKEEMKALPEQIRLQQAEGQFIELGGGVFTLDMLSFMDAGELKDTNYTYVLGVDVGVEADANRARERDTDYWAAVLLAVHPRHAEAYVIDAIRERGLTLKQGVDWVSAIAANIDPIHIYVESNQSQRWLKQELADQGLNAVAVHNTEKKEDRILQISIPLERGTVKFVNQPPPEPPEDAPEEAHERYKEKKAVYEKKVNQTGYDPRWKDVIGELLAFPDGSHDDLADALQIAVDNSGVVGSNLILGSDPYNDPEKTTGDPRIMD